MASKVKGTTTNKKKTLEPRLSSFDLNAVGKSVTVISKSGKSRKTSQTTKDGSSKNAAKTDKEKPGKVVHDKSTEEKFDKMLEGDLTDLPQLPHSVVRIFLSSTFSDMRAERNILAKEVYPKLKEVCSNYDLDFQVVDMRWGVTEDSQNDHSVEKICLLEVENCQRVSLGPNFVLISGDRYGFRPVPTEIDVEEFETLLQFAKEKQLENLKLLETWYLLDENAKPPMYILQPINSQFPFFGDYSPGCDEPRKQDTENWRNTFTLLQELLRKAANAAFKAKKLKPHQLHQYFLSVTECEVTKGILEATDPKDHVLVYQRHLKDVNEDVLKDEIAKRFVDVIEQDGRVQINDETKNLREDLLLTKIPNIMKKTGCHSYNIPWKSGGVDPGDQEHSDYLVDFCISFIQDVIKLIEKALHEKEIQIRTTEYYSYYQETLHHLHFCKSKCRSFCGQEEILEKAKDYILNDTSRKPFVLYAPSGAGKTSVMAMIMNSLSSWFKKKEYAAVIRFLGTSPASTNIYDVLFSVCGQLADVAELIMEPVGYKNMKNLVDYIPRFLRRVASKLKSPIVILLDSLDQLSRANDSYSCTWLPTTLPASIKIILSTLPEEHGILNNLRQVLPEKDSYCEIPVLSDSTGRQIIDKYLGQKKRTLTRIQEKLILRTFASAPGPLYLKLLLDEAMKWNSYTPEHHLNLGNSVQGAISQLFENLEKKFGQIITSHALGFITIGMTGISEIEIEDALSCDDEALDDVFRHHNPPVDGIVRIPPVLWARIHYDLQEYLVERISFGKHTLNWYHRQFIETARARYTTGHQAEKLHTIMAETFMAENGVQRDIKLTRRKITIPNADRQVTLKPISAQNKRTLACLPYHIIHAGSYLKDTVAKDSCFCNFKFLRTKLAAFSSSSLEDELNDFLEKQEDEEIQILRHFFVVCKTDLSQPTKLAVNLLSHIDTDPIHVSLRKLLKQAEEFLSSGAKPALIPVYPGLAPRTDSSSALIESLEHCEAILSESVEVILIRTCGKQVDNESKDVHAIFNTVTRELQPIPLPDISNTDLYQKLDHEGKQILYTVDGKIETLNLTTMKTVTKSFSSISAQLTEKDSKPVLTVFSSDTAHFVILFQDSDVLVLETSGMKKVFLATLKEEAEDVRGLICTNMDNLILIVLGTKEAADKGPSTGFIRLYYPGQEKAEKYVQFGHPFTRKLSELCSSESLIVTAINSEVDSKISCIELESLEERTEIALKSEILQLMTSKSKPMAATLTKDGTVHILDCSEGVINHKFVTNNPISCFGVSWVHNLAFLGDIQGQITLYAMKTGQHNGSFPAHPAAIQKISVLDDHVMTLGANQEINAWSISSILEDMHQSKLERSKGGKMSELINQKEVCSFDVDVESIVTASRDKIVRVWTIDKAEFRQQHKIGIKGDKIQLAAGNVCVALEKSSGKMKLFDINSGDDVFSDVPDYCLDFTLSKDLNNVYALSKDKNDGLHANIIDLKLRKMKKSFLLKSGPKYETIDISVNANERFLILRWKCTPEDLKEIEASWKKQGSFLPQYHPYRFMAVDLFQASGGLSPCYRIMTKIPTLGEVTEAYQGNVVMVTTRRTVVFWDIPVAKCDQKVSWSFKKGMMYRPDWIGQGCKGTTLAIKQSTDGNFVALGSEDGYVIIYEAESGVPVKKKVPSTKHAAPVIHVAGSQNSAWFVSACRNHIIKLWDAASGTEVFSFRVDAEIRQIKFSRDSKYLVIYTGSHITRVLVYRLYSGKQN